MKKGALIGEGMTAEVYKWGSDKVLKLFFEKYTDERVQYEAEIGRIVHSAAAPSPAVYDVIEVDGRRGILFQRIRGKSIQKLIKAEPWKMFHYAKQMARLQYRIHQCSTDLLPSQAERLAIIIGKSSERLGDKEKRILDYIDQLPTGTSVCHGDIHYNNIIISGKKSMAVDWHNTCTGNPLGDVARTCLMIITPAANPGIPKIFTLPVRYVKRLAYKAYVNEYMRLAKVSFKSIDEWILPAAAAKLKDKAIGEEKWLMDIINKRLDKLEQTVLNKLT